MPRSTTPSRSRKTLPSSAKRRLEFGARREETETAHGNDGEGSTVIRGSDEGPPPASSVGETPAKKRRSGDHSNSFSSPAVDGGAAPAVVTPEKLEESATWAETDARGETKGGDGRYVPLYIHRNLNYQRRGRASLSAALRATFALVERHYRLPSDLETNRAYGPLSGTCYEERAVEAYGLGLLQPKEGAADAGGEGGTAVAICSHCAVLGHIRDDCPDLI
jgi:hypothetical protein